MAHVTPKVPGPLLAAAGALAVSSLLLTGFARLTDIGVQKLPDIVAVERVALNFEDEANGGVAVVDHATGERLYTYAPETGGFVRTALRSFAYTRAKAGIGREPPFELARDGEGRIVLSDPSTGKTVDLEAFGDDNEKDFAMLLDLGKARAR